ncbi:transcriptional repressor, LexA family [Ruminiclostridium papyrosolvens DSM 2782]|uniref:LexA repressor n=1 Tax=Ruminiclostridium papyrosolvens DSM 2782 TaxID=588581 RepID=F1TA47_9FIRM|nr:transcriptional repressor LexA [Ruminiclostridium papyrosolvens]EGD48789.1 transcriptional repressor, LexA family [Ruminiclostridium papyrosolvens DSM 2782]WES32457.1 transcriptional repressor LexA [Ruminiclostridium papyrosolvens DSM 2782]
MAKKNSNKQQEILDYVYKCVHENGYPPSVREICSAVGFKSTSTVHSYLQKLIDSGLLQKDPTKPRAIKILNRASQVKESRTSKDGYYTSREMVDVPVVGRVTAGQPILAVENITDTFPLPVDFVQNSDAFMLRIQGESMVEAGILDKDFVLVRQQSSANNGDIVVALIGDEATCKTFYREKDYIRLQPQNSSMEPILVKDDLSILGKVIGVFRRM